MMLPNAASTRLVISREPFARLGRLARWPAVPGELEAGQEAWAEFVSLATPRDRQRLLDAAWPWFSPELIASEPATERLESWFALGGPTLSRRTVARDLIVLGLDGVRALLVSALRRCPPPVVHHVVHRVWVLGCGRGLSGWMSQAPPWPISGTVQLVVLDGKLPGQELLGLLAHEVAHSWLLPTAPPADVQRIRERVVHRQRISRLAHAWHLPNPLVRGVERDERAAAALARAWGFDGPAADPDYCAAVGRLAAMRDLG